MAQLQYFEFCFKLAMIAITPIIINNSAIMSGALLVVPLIWCTARSSVDNINSNNPTAAKFFLYFSTKSIVVSFIFILYLYQL